MKELKRKVTRLVNSVEVFELCFGACTCVDACISACFSGPLPFDVWRDILDSARADMDNQSHVA